MVSFTLVYYFMNLAVDIVLVLKPVRHSVTSYWVVACAISGAPTLWSSSLQELAPSLFVCGKGVERAQAALSTARSKGVKTRTSSARNTTAGVDISMTSNPVLSAMAAGSGGGAGGMRGKGVATSMDISGIEGVPTPVQWHHIKAEYSSMQESIMVCCLRR